MIKIDIAKCTGCRMCETACSFYHTGRVNRNNARIKVVHHYETGIDGPVVCVQCKERFCLDCSESAISVGKYGEIKISHTVCNFCKKCAKACPIGAIDPFEAFMYVCDLCGGDPKCVKACTESAVTYLADVSGEVSLQNIKSQTNKMNISEKKAFLTHHRGKRLRENWRDSQC
jgi:anaerobic carbon-monoxide dehydrogenase iron sulfur subunit